jgi:hypothetical protein
MLVHFADAYGKYIVHSIAFRVFVLLLVALLV